VVFSVFGLILVWTALTLSGLQYCVLKKLHSVWNWNWLNLSF